MVVMVVEKGKRMVLGRIFNKDHTLVGLLIVP